MAVAYDNVGPSSSGAGNTSGTTLSWSHTVNTGPADIFVGLSSDTVDGSTTSATCDGTSMTSLAVVFTSGGGSGAGYLQVWRITGQSAGSHAIVVTKSDSSSDMEGGSISFTGVSSIGTAATASGNSVTLSDTSGNLIVSFFAAGGNISGFSTGTSRFIINEVGGSGAWTGNGAGGTQAATGSDTVTWASSATSNAEAIFALELQGSGGGGGPTPLTLYGNATNDTTLATARQLVTTAPSSESHVSATGQLAKSATGWIELASQGGSSTTLAGTEPTTPTGNGYIFDSTSLEGQTIIAGTWTPSWKVGCVGGSFIGVLHVRAWKRSSGGVYTQLTSGGTPTDIVASSATLATTGTALTFSGQALDATAFATGDKLYVDLIFQITTGNSNNTASNRVITLYENGGSPEKLVTPGYEVVATAGAAAVTVSAFNPTGSTSGNANPTADAAAVTAAALQPSVAVVQPANQIAPIPAEFFLAQFGLIYPQPTPTTSASVTANPGVAPATVAAFNPSVRVDANPTVGVGSVTVTAASPTPQVAAQPSAAAVTVAAFGPSVEGDAHPTPGVGAATVAALAPVPQVTALPSSAAVTVSAFAPGVEGDAHPTAGAGNVTASAFGPVPQVTAFPSAAAVTVAALNPSVTAGGNITANPGVGSVTVAAFGPPPQVAALPSVAPVTVSAANPASSITASAGVGNVAVAGLAPTPDVTALPSVAPANAAAFNPTVNIGGNVTATPGVAAVSVTAFGPTPQIGIVPGAASATAAAFTATGVLVTAAGAAPVTVAAYQPAPAIRFTAGVAPVGVAANNSSVAVGATAGAAQATTTGFPASVSISFEVGEVIVTVTALAPLFSHAPIVTVQTRARPRTATTQTGIRTVATNVRTRTVETQGS